MAGKVGDTLTATVAPEKATNVTYAWYMGDTAANISTEIAGVVGNQLAVTSDMVGKYIQVVVKGDNDSTANAATVAAVQEAAAAEIAISAKQTGAKKVEVSYTTGEYSTGSTVKVTKGSQTVKVDASTTSDDKKTLTLTTAENLTDGEYKVEITTSANKKGEATFTGAKPVLTEVKFTNNKLCVSSNTTEGMKKGYAHIESYDQFGEHMNLTSPSFTCSKGDVSFKSDTGILTFDASSIADADKTYKLGEMVVVSVMYDNNTKVVPCTLTVTTAAMVQTLTFGDLTSDDTTTYPTDKITQTDLARGVYWFPVTEAKDDSGISLDVDRLNDMLDADVQTLFVTPNSSQGTIIYADQFSEKTVNGKKTIALVVKGGTELAGLNAGVEMMLSVFSTGGAQATLPVKITRDAVIKDLDIDIPDLYVGKESEIKFSATDTDGNKVDLYKVTSNLSLASQSDDYKSQSKVNGTGSAAIRFWDTAKGQEVIGTKINISVGSLVADYELVRNATNHEVSLKITPAANGGSKDGYLNMTGTTAAYTAITKANIKINESRTVDGVSGFDSISEKVLNTDVAAQTLSGDNTLFTLTDGSTQNADKSRAFYVANDTGLAATPSAAANIAANAAGTDIAIDANVAEGLVYSMELVGSKLVADGAKSSAQDAIMTAIGGGFGEAAYYGNGFVLDTKANTSTWGTFATATNGVADLYVIPGAATGKSDTVKIKLYKVTKVSTDDAKDTKVELLGTKSVTFTVENENTVSYKIKLDDKDNIMYAGDGSADFLPIEFKTTGGADVPLAKIKSVSVINKNNDGAVFDYAGGAIWCTTKSDAKPGTKSTATITATIESNGDVVEATQDFTYVTDQPVVTYVGVYDNADMNDGDLVAGNKVNVNVTGAVGADQGIGHGACGVWIKYQDQYYTDAATDGLTVNATVANDTTDGVTNVTYTGADSDGLVNFTDPTRVEGETFQIVINGGIPLTLYCTVEKTTTETQEYVADALNKDDVIKANAAGNTLTLLSSYEGSDITWTSSDTDLISNAGALNVTAAEALVADANVTMTATISRDGYADEVVTFVVTVDDGTDSITAIADGAAV